jgi:type VI secretion system protein ImpL
MGVYWATAAILLPYLVLAWFLGTWLHLQGSSLWILRGGLALIGIIAAGVFFFFYRKASAGAPAEEEGTGDSVQDVDTLVHDAVRKLRESSLGRSASLGKLPVVFLLGDSDSAKTHTIINSSLDPELLAGHVYQDNQILPTQALNFWYTRHAIFADVSGSLFRDSKNWSRLVRLLQPGRVSSALKQGQQAPRAAIVCFDCGRFLEKGASEAVTVSARQIGARLQQMSQLLGISVPVYVLFTKIDRFSFFSEYVRNFNKDEANSVFGTTLPVRPTHGVGVYADEETRRLEKAFDELFYSLSDRRLDLLVREHEPEKRSLVYEFPRELKKTRKLLVSFLVDMARPSQLQVNPFLRGFYFSGVRPVVIDDVVAATPNQYAPAPDSDAGATRIFSAGQFRAPQPATERVAGSRKVPQWMFLSQFFNAVLLKDQVAFRTSGFSTRVSTFRRIALVLCAFIGLLCIAFISISFLQNRALEDQVRTAANQVPELHLSGGQLASISDLQGLEKLRAVVFRLRNYQESGPPWHMRWGLYVGDALYPGARRLYFQRFDEMLFRQTQGNIVNALRNLKDKPAPEDTYDKPYAELRAYLITTSNPEKSTTDFLSPVLLSHWTNGRDVDAERADLVRRQFDYYSSELPKNNPFSSQNDGHLIARTRTYLAQFQETERVYRALLAEADKRAPATSFNEQFKDSASTVLSNYRVRGAFTQTGAAFMKEALHQPNRYVSGEVWVLGPIAQQMDPSALEQRLNDHYAQDFISEWRNVVKKTQVRNYENLADAESKLGTLTSPTSPLLEFFSFVSQNTNVENQAVKDSFQPSAAVVPPGSTDKYRLPNNEGYVAALSGLQAAISTLEKSPSITDPNSTKPVLDAAGEGHKAVNKLAGSFRVDPEGGIEKSVQQLLEQPITYAEELAGRASLDKVNRSGAEFCAQFGQLSGKFPFNPKASQELSMTQLNQLLAPNTGSLWTFYSSTLAPLLVKQGSHYSAAPGAISVSPRFLDFFNRSVALSDALYPGGSPTPHFGFTLKPLPSNLEGFVLKIGSEMLNSSEPEKTFYWTGNGENVEVTSKGGDTVETDQGTWGVFRFMMSAHWTGPDLEWISQSNGRNVLLPNGKLKSFRYQLQVNGFNPLRPGELSALRCVPQVTQ